MKVRFKEDPREWRKFTLSFGGAPLVLAGLLWWRGWIAAPGFLLVLATVVVLEVVVLAVPAWCRAFYRGGLRVTSRLGHFMGQFLLTLVFFLLLTPIGWTLRLLGKDLLQLKRRPDRQTYWHPARSDGALDRMY